MSELAKTVDQVAEAVKGFRSEYDHRLNELETHVARASRGSRFGDDAGPETKAMRSWLRGEGLDTKALSVTSDGDGVTVREDWVDQIFKLIRESSPLRQVANVIGTDSKSVEVLVDRGEPASDWVAEVASRSATSASFMTRQAIPVHEHYALPSATLQMLEDSRFDVEQWLQGKIASRFARQEAAAFINGDGQGKPRGILDYDFVPESAFTWGADPADYVIGSQYTGANGEFTSDPDGADVLFDLVDALKADYLPGARWMMSRSTMNLIRKLKDGEGRPLLHASLAEGRPNQLLGYPVTLAEDLPAPDTDSVSVLFGDFGQAYTVVDRVGLSVIRDPYSNPGFVRWYVRRRIGGALTNPEAVKALVFGSEPN